MIKTVQKPTIICDDCGKDLGSYSTYCCRGCGKHSCYECGNGKSFVEYQHAVSFSGSGDGNYCLDCDKKLMANGDALHAAYRRIQILREERSAYYAEFSKRCEEAEQEVQRLLKTASS